MVIYLAKIVYEGNRRNSRSKRRRVRKTRKLEGATWAECIAQLSESEKDYLVEIRQISN